MEKASTPRNRLTRSSAKQVNTPKNVEQEELLEKEGEEIKRNVRKTRRKTDSKTDTNGDATSNENKVNNEDVVEENIRDGSKSEAPSEGNDSVDPSRTTPEKTLSPRNIRRSLRPRRSSTSAQDLDSSVGKMKRSSSSSKLDLCSTPTNKRGRRAQSESKDFVFTPKNSSSNLNDPKCENIPSACVKIYKIEEVNEVEKLSDDEKHSENDLASKQSGNESKSEVDSKQAELIIRTVDSADPIVKENSNISPLKKETETSCANKSSSNVETDPKEDSTEDIKPIAETAGNKPLPEHSSTPDSNENPLNSTVILEVNESFTVCETVKDVDNSVSKHVVSANVHSENIELVDYDEVIPESTMFNSRSEENKINENDTGETEELSKENKLDIDDEVATESASCNASISEANTFDRDESVFLNYEDLKQSNDENNFEVNDDNSKNNDEYSKLDENEREVMSEINGHVQSNNKVRMDEIGIKLLETSNRIKDVQSKPIHFTNEVTEEIDLIISSDSEEGVFETKTDNNSLETQKVSEVNTDNNQVNTSDVTYNTLEDKCLKEDGETKLEKELSSIPGNKSHMDSNISYDNHQETIDYNENSEFDQNTTELNNTQKEVYNHVAPEVTEPDDLDNRTEEEDESIGIKIESSMTVENSKVFEMGSSAPLENADDAQQLKDPLLENNLTDKEKRLNNEQYLELDDHAANQSACKSDLELKLRSVVNELYEEELNKSEGESCDIYKGLSDDSGSYADDPDGENEYYEGSHSSRINYDESGDSEYISSGEEEEAEENDGKKNELANNLGSESVDIKDKVIALSMNAEKPNEKNPDSPMTYDKVLSLINKNRVKKIDDEEFFDMFTEELNRVSEKSGSDSDIAIVDEYLMEPEDPLSKKQEKPVAGQNVAKQTPRLSGPVQSQLHLPQENYPNDYNQPLYDQHGVPLNQHRHQMPPALQRANFPPSSVYQQYDHNMPYRDHNMMFNQYGHPSSSMQDPYFMDPNMDYTRYNHPHSLGPVPTPSFPNNTTSLKVRAMADTNAAPTVPGRKYSKSDLDPSDRSFKHQGDDYSNKSSPPHDVNRRTESDSGKGEDLASKNVESKTPILDLLGLDEKALKLLKKVLGLGTLEKQLMNRNLEWLKKCLEKSIAKSKKSLSPGRNKERFKRFRERSSSSSSQTDVETTSDEASSGGISKSRNVRSSSESETRRIDIEDGSVLVTLQNKKLRYRSKRSKQYGKKACDPEPESLGGKRYRRNFKMKFTKTYEPYSKKMVKKQPTVIKAQSGTFKVDPLTTSQSSESEAPSVDKFDLPKKMKTDRASGRNKLSNMFAQRSFKNSKEPKKRRFDSSQEDQFTVQDMKELRKLPTQILEMLANEENDKKRQRADDSSSGGKHEQPKKKIRMRSRKLKVKSSARDQSYIPCVTGGTTEFGLSRLDKDAALTLAETAAKFRSDQLYGSAVKRITSKELLNVKKKQNINRMLAEKKRGKKRSSQ